LNPMSVDVGTRLGSYEITGLLGKGGMGEVYRARDAKLKREVALKILPEEFSRDPARVSRFQREAEVLASLNHPNIGAIYDLQEANGTRFLVLELIDGETLADRIQHGAIPVQDALDIAKHICEALEAAHEKGIVHRDLKPGNVMLTKVGNVKVLDFGLAKAYETTPSSASGSNSPTLATMAATVGGVIVGTAAYMSPEQAKGKPVDKRSDIWAFGVVVYEMLTGRSLFAGETVTETLAAVIEREPDWRRVPAKVLPVLRRCLEKDPKRRLRDIGDVMAWIESTPEASTEPATLRSITRWLWPAVVAVLVVALVAVFWNLRQTPPRVDLPFVRQDVDLGEDIALPPQPTFLPNVAISPDGTRLAYVASPLAGGPTRLFTRRLDQPKATALAGTEGAQRPFFSPDGHWLGFNVNRKLNKISVEGGAVVPLMDLTGTFGGAAWAPDGIIVAQQGSFLVKITEGGGSPPAQVTDLLKGEGIQASPQLLPGGKAVLFTSNFGTDRDNATVDVVTFSSHQRKRLVTGGAYPRFAPSRGVKAGHLLYVFKEALYAIPFDAENLETHGTAVPILDDLIGTATFPGKFDMSQMGTMVYQKSSSGSRMSTVQWVDSTGKSQALLSRQGIYQRPRVSPDGQQVALAVSEGSATNIQVYEWQNDRTTKLTFGDRGFNTPIWSADGQFVVFTSSQGGMFWARADGSGQPEPLTAGPATQVPSSFSLDGKRLAFVEPLGIWTIPLDIQGGQLKAGTPEPFIKDQVNVGQPSFSPDGKWLAYASNEGARGIPEVYVRPFPAQPGQGGKWVISNQGGQRPVWSLTSHDLLYLSPGGQIMVASYTVKGDRFIAEKPRVWLAKLGGTDFDLSPDGKHLAVVAPVETLQALKPDHIVVFLQNFFDELRRRVPTDN
jgi:serine/threonine-protein kinase